MEQVSRQTPEQDSVVALGRVSVGGRQHWFYSDGTLLPVVSGGASTEPSEPSEPPTPPEPPAPPAPGGDPEPPAPGEPTPPPTGSGPVDWEAATRDARNDAAKYRTQLRETETKLTNIQKQLEEFQTGQLSEQERLQKERDSLRDQVSSQASDLQNLNLKFQVVRQGFSLGIIDSDTAEALIEQRREQVDFDSHGSPTNVRELLEKLIEEKPFLKGRSTAPPPDPGAGGSGNGHQQGATLKRADLDKMSPGEINEALKDGRLNDILGAKNR